MSFVHPSSIQYLPTGLSQTYINYVNYNCDRLSAMNLKRHSEGSKYASYSYRMAKHIHTMFLKINKYIDQLEFSIEDNNSIIKNHLQSTHIVVRDLIRDFIHLSQDEKLFNVMQRKYLRRVLHTLSKTDRVISGRKQIVTDLLLDHTPLYQDTVSYVLDFL